MGRRTIRRLPAGRLRDGEGLHLADEVRYIQDKADHDGRMVTIDPLVLFSADIGDAWLLDVTDHPAARLARHGGPELIHLEESDITFAIEWKGQYRIEGAPFVHADRDNGRITRFSATLRKKIAQGGWSGNFKDVWLGIKRINRHIPLTAVDDAHLCDHSTPLELIKAGSAMRQVRRREHKYLNEKPGSVQGGVVHPFAEPQVSRFVHVALPLSA